MKRKFTISVCRTGYGHRDIEVEAESQAQAESLALDEAGDYDYSEHSSEYSLEGVTDSSGETAITPITISAENLEEVRGVIANAFLKATGDYSDRFADSLLLDLENLMDRLVN